MVTITIQAPAGGATLQVVAQHRALDVSIHAPAGGATRTLKPRKTIGTCVSIHAPAGGATPDAIVGDHVGCRFNPRARGGRDCRIITH